MRVGASAQVHRVRNLTEEEMELLVLNQEDKDHKEKNPQEM